MGHLVGHRASSAIVALLAFELHSRRRLHEQLRLSE